MKIFVCFLAALILFCLCISGIEQDRSTETVTNLENALRRAAVACYAAEGSYPPDAAYLQEHYGIQFNEEIYTVRYQLIASNLMPDITVLEKQP